MEEDMPLPVVAAILAVAVWFTFLGTDLVVDDTSDRALEACISVCRDKVASYTPSECVCQDGTRLTTGGK